MPPTRSPSLNAAFGAGQLSTAGLSFHAATTANDEEPSRGRPLQPARRHRPRWPSGSCGPSRTPVPTTRTGRTGSPGARSEEVTAIEDDAGQQAPGDLRPHEELEDRARRRDRGRRCRLSPGERRRHHEAAPGPARSSFKTDRRFFPPAVPMLRSDSGGSRPDSLVEPTARALVSALTLIRPGPSLPQAQREHTRKPAIASASWYVGLPGGGVATSFPRTEPGKQFSRRFLLPLVRLPIVTCAGRSMSTRFLRLVSEGRSQLCGHA